MEALNEERKSLIQEYDSGRHRQRELSEAFRAKGGPTGDLSNAREELKSLGGKLKELEHRRSEVEETLQSTLMMLPNLPDESVPVGADEDDNVVVREWGEKPNLDFEAKDHVDVGEPLGILDGKLERISGSRFALYRGAGSRLERALMMFMLDMHTESHGYESVHALYGAPEVHGGDGTTSQIRG